MAKPNVIVVFGDQWRAQATGYSGNPGVKTPNLDALEEESINFTHAVAGCPVCSPYRASLLTGQHPLTHGVFVNDVTLNPNAASIAKVFKVVGYDTAYVGKWHVDGQGRSSYIPRERRQGFEYWKVLECTHSYNKSAYYAGDSDEKLFWDGYDAIAQTQDAIGYIRDRRRDRPFFMVLSWGPPHAPYHTAPAKYAAMYDPKRIALRPNVQLAPVPDMPEWDAQRYGPPKDIAGYYAHCSALDACVGDLVGTLQEEGIESDTVLLFTSDHGDMLGSQGHGKKQRPWDESIRVPFLLRYPGLPGWQPRRTDAVVDAPDIMPTLLGLCDIDVPDTVEGLDFSGHIQGWSDPSEGAAVIACPHPFGQFERRNGGREYRGLRTTRHTYVRTLDGPWLLYDNEADPFQLENLAGRSECRDLQEKLETELQRRLAERGDEFLPGAEYIRRWGYTVSDKGTVPYKS